MLRETRLTVVHFVLLAFAAALVGRAGYVQLWQRQKWDRLAMRQHYARGTLGAPRGEIADFAGLRLAQSQVKVHLAVVPGEVKERRRLVRALQHLAVDPATLARTGDRSRKWVPINRAFFPSDVVALQAMPGVHSDASAQREYLPSPGMRSIVGHISDDGAGVDGVELMLDSLLRGERGTAAPLVGAKGERYESPELLTRPPRPGHSITLTISTALQDICDRALDDATARFSASGGDLIVLDPRDGEIRCLASRRPGGLVSTSSGLTEPFEPGSTLKPFFAAYLLESGKARRGDVVETFNGRYTTHGRTITDVHKAERLSLADVIRYSSNVGIVRFTERLSPGEMYETLRDFGFGTPTGVPFPSEAPGILREPQRWSGQSQASVAIGYEISVTPLQLAAAYAAIANGGLLLTPTLVREIRDADGAVIYAHRPAVVRRVLQPQTTRTLREMLASVVDSGTAVEAGLSSYEFGGKSGTARRVRNGRYGGGSYTSTFVGLFPAAEPQYVVLVKLDDPRGVYYGGKAAAPVARAVIEAAIAAPNAALSASDLAMQRVQYVPAAGDNTGRPAAGTRAEHADAGTTADDLRGASPYPSVDSVTPVEQPRPVRFDLGRARPDSAPRASMVAVPDVRGLSLRAAVRELHRAGLRVAFVSGSGTVPAAGATVTRGSLVRLGRQ